MKKPKHIFWAMLLFSSLALTYACSGNADQSSDSPSDNTYRDTIVDNDPLMGNDMRNQQPTEPLTERDSVNTDTL